MNKLRGAEYGITRVDDALNEALLNAPAPHECKSASLKYPNAPAAFAPRASLRRD
jgi:hypothetical protein